LQHAQHVSGFFKECGVLQQVECWGDDVPQGKLTSQPMAVQCKPDETVVLSWLVWPSREVRDEAMVDANHGDAKNDDGPAHAEHDMPFDGHRMIFGGFEVILEI